MSLPRYKRAEYLVAGVLVAGGIAAVLLWPQLKKLVSGGTVSTETPNIRQGGFPIQPSGQFENPFTNPYAYL